MRLFREGTNEPVQLPAELENFRGQTEYVTAIVEESAPGRAGKVEIDRGLGVTQTVYPGVFRCYIANAPREAATA